MSSPDLRKRPTEKILSTDLSEILAQAENSFRELQDQRLLFTGGTGFFGKWLTQAFLAAEKRYNLNLKIELLSRRGSAVIHEMPWLQDPMFQIHQGDVRSFSKDLGPIDTIIHGAVEASAQLNEQHPEEMFLTNLEGTSRMLQLARTAKTRRFLLTSSGAVYGRQPYDLIHTPEDWIGGPDPLNSKSAYAEGKRAAELISALAATAQGFEFKVARCFAFVGPYLPLDTHFAAGNFMGACLKNETLQILGDGTPHRSLMYGTDLVVWLLRILTHGQSHRAYNVGSDHTISILEMAQAIDRVSAEFIDRGKLESRIRVHREVAAPGKPERYVPSVERAKTELGLKLSVNLDDALRRSFQWYTQDRQFQSR